MSGTAPAAELHPLEIKVLLGLGQTEPLTSSVLEERLGLNEGQCNQVFSWLSLKGLVAERERTRIAEYELTETGREHLERGTPEERMVDLLEDAGPLALPAIAARLGLEQGDVGSAFGSLSRAGLLALDGEKRASVADPTKRQAM